MDYVPIKFLIQCFEANYPESLGCILIHNAPWVFKSKLQPPRLSPLTFPGSSSSFPLYFKKKINQGNSQLINLLSSGVWKIIHGWLDPVVASKVHFTNGVDGITEYIAPEQLVQELGGANPWVYEYVPPVPGENDRMKDTATRDKLLAQRRALTAEFEGKTREWAAVAAGDKATSERIKAERDAIAKRLAANFWELDPYLRARSLYDRLGVFQGEGKVDWSAAKRTQDALKAAAETNGTKSK